MTATTLTEDLDANRDYGTFDSALFSQQTLVNWQSLASVIDHTLLKAETTRDQIKNLCEEALRYRFGYVIVSPVWVSTAVKILYKSGITVGSVIGFPLGATLTSTLRHDAQALIRLGARELDMVMPIGLLKSGRFQPVQRAIHGVCTLSHHHGVKVKVILEAALLTTEEKLHASELAIQAGADFIKTSTGFQAGGATAADVLLMRGVAGARCGVKAAGGIRTLADVRAMLEAGASRIGSSASVSIVREMGAE